MRGERARGYGGRAVVTVAFVCAGLLMFVGPAGPATQWRVVPYPFPNGGGLKAVSCASAQMCFATGGSDSGAFIDRWNGTRWSSIASPSLPNGYLAGVSCPTVRFCFAVGYTSQGTGQGVLERWDGGRWTRQFSKALTNPETSLSS